LPTAIQMLRSDDVEQALIQASGEQLAAMAEQEWFPTVCQDVVDRASSAWAPTIAANAACAMADAGLDDEKWSGVWGNLTRAVFKPEDWKALEPTTGRGLALLITRSPLPMAPDWLRDCYGRLAPPCLSSRPRQMSEASSAWVDTTLSILRAIGESGLRRKVDIDAVFRVPGDADFYIEVMTDLLDAEPEEDLASLYLPTAPPSR